MAVLAVGIFAALSDLGSRRLTASDGSNAIMTGVVLVAAFCLYFLPSIVAVQRRTKNQNAVAVVNLFLGWTFLGWVIALAMAAGGARRDEVQLVAAAAAAPAAMTKRCPQCAEEIQAAARLCRFCRYEFT